MKLTTTTALRGLGLLVVLASLGACGPNENRAETGVDADLFDVILRPDAVAPAEAAADVPASDVPATDGPASDVLAVDAVATDGGDGGATDAAAEASTEAGAADGGSCRGADNCYACVPTESAQFLDRCSDGRCTRFDNAARLPLFNGGMLPPLR